MRFGWGNCSSNGVVGVGMWYCCKLKGGDEVVIFYIVLSLCWERSIWSSGVVVCGGEREGCVGGEWFEVYCWVDKWENERCRGDIWNRSWLIKKVEIDIGNCGRVICLGMECCYWGSW